MLNEKYIEIYVICQDNNVIRLVLRIVCDGLSIYYFITLR